MLQVNASASYFKHEAPCDVFMPCVKGSKAPLFPHRGNVWSWSDFDAFVKQNRHVMRTHDIGILLRDLCVVDVDSVDQAQRLEREFPELSTVPCEATRKGRHYFFRRSALADDGGYYDGPAQVERGIDFKTVGQSGTSGFLVIAPSTGKQWIRAPWQSSFQPIGDALLKRVAVPRESSVSQVDVTFRDEEMCVKMRGLQDVSVFEDFMSGAVLGPVPLPMFDSEYMVALIEAHQHGITTCLPTQTYVSRMLELADFIGFPIKSRMIRSLRPGGIMGTLIDVHRHFPEMAVAMHAEMRYRSGIGEPDKATDVLIPDVQVSIDKEHYLFGHCTKSRPMVRKELECPEFVKDFLNEFPGELVLAGGGALHAAVDCDEPGDYDFFICGSSAERAVEIVRCITRKNAVIHQTPYAVTMSTQGQLAQIILRRYESIEHLLTSFDIAPCKVALMSENGNIVAKAMPTWMLSIATSTFVLDASMWGAPSVFRILKYASRGFRVFVPNLARQHMKKNELRHFKGVSQLFAYETDRRCIMPDRRELAEDLRVMFARDRTLKHSDYDIFQRVTKGVIGLYYWMKHVLSIPVKRRSVDVVPLAPRASNYHARSPGWNFMYNPGWTADFVSTLTDKVHLQQSFL